MAMVTNKTFTLQELAKIALGATELTNDHLSVLKSLVVILLQKLDCENERVRITGFPAQCIQGLLKDNAEVDHFDFQMATVKGFKEKYKLLDDVEKKAKEFDLKMQEHNNEIRSHFYRRNIYNPEVYDAYIGPTEDLCNLFTHCSLVCNSIFNIELHSRALPSIMKRFDGMENKIINMQAKLQKLEEMANEVEPYLLEIENIFKDIEHIRGFLLKRDQDFYDAMSETDEMINCKLDRYTLPGLKKYLDRQFSNFRTRLRVTKDVFEKTFCSKGAVLKAEKTCLSCSHQKELDDFTEGEKLPIHRSGLCISFKQPPLLQKIYGIKKSICN